MDKQHVAILGSTGSIGTQALEVIANCSDFFGVETLTANDNWELLVRQAVAFQPNQVVIGNEAHYPKVKEALRDHYIKVYAGAEAIEQIAGHTGTDIVISSLVGYAGLFPTMNAIRHKKKIALANKETLVVAGELVMRTAKENEVPVIPVDSEHSAVFQSLAGESSPVEKIILTASGGPFWDVPFEKMETATPEQALNHPNWQMGNKITIDSATMMNKGFEVIEACWLFDVKPEQVEVVIHPQSVVHSMVQFADGAIKAQMGIPDMKLPIQYALTFPYRLPIRGNRFDFKNGARFDFFTPDPEKFACLQLAYEGLKKGGNACCAMNAANEVAVEAFLNGRIGFMQIAPIIRKTMEQTGFVPAPSLDDYKMTDTEARHIARRIIEKIR